MREEAIERGDNISRKGDNDDIPAPQESNRNRESSDDIIPDREGSNNTGPARE